jgi:hypothetical protein
MNKASFHFPRLAAGSFWAVALGVCLSLPGFASGSDLQAANAAAESDLSGNQTVASLSDYTVSLGPVTEYDHGVQTAVAAHPSGLFIEFHKTEALSNGTIWYRIGRSDREKVVWGGSQKSGASGYWPAAAISKEGCVILVLSDAQYKSDSTLNYRVGKINLSGGVDQSIQWVTDSIHWDAGFHASIAINSNNVVVGVHESGHGGSGLYYRVGHFYPASGNYSVQWTGPTWGMYYDDGINPHIALNNRNEVVEVHQVTGEKLLHYWRGTVSNGKIQFVASRRYNNNAQQPAVALSDNGQVLEAHANNDQTEIVLTSGILSPNDAALIEWGSSVGLHRNIPWKLHYPALATGGTDFVVTFEDAGRDSTYGLWHVFGVICSYANGTLVTGSSDKVYVVLNNHRYWIPNADTFDALGYRWDEILWLSDDELNAIPERAPFPSVVPVSGPLNYPNGTLVKGLTSKVYVVLNDCRHWIPDSTTFEAMGYDYDKILYLFAVAEAMPESDPLPTVGAR